MEARIAAILKTVADVVDHIATPGQFDTRDAIHQAIYDQDYVNRFSAIWERDGAAAARAFDKDLNGLYSATMRAVFPDGDSMRFIPGDDLRAIANLLP